MDRTTKDHFVKTVVSSFAFLTKEFGFSQPMVGGDDAAGLAWVVYKRTNAGLKVVLDSRDGAVDCYVGRLVNGDFPEHAFDASGSRIREDLFGYLVRTRKYRGAISKRPEGGSLQDVVSLDVPGFARLVREEGDAITADSPGLFAH
jgi:hypothetical protein